MKYVIKWKKIKMNHCRTIDWISRQPANRMIISMIYFDFEFIANEIYGLLWYMHTENWLKFHLKTESIKKPFIIVDNWVNQHILFCCCGHCYNSIAFNWMQMYYVLNWFEIFTVSPKMISPFFFILSSIRMKDNSTKWKWNDL